MGVEENTVIIVNGLEAGKKDDDILQELFEAGVSFGELRTVFNAVIKEKGLRMTAKERKAKASEILEGITKIETAKDVTCLVEKLSSELKVDNGKALNTLKNWAKENEVALPKVRKNPKQRKVGFGGHYAKILDYAFENRNLDKKDIINFCQENEIPATYVTHAFNVVHYARKWNGEANTSTTD